MTVALIGVGADDSNSNPYPTVYDDGSFEYIPIPEAHPTIENRTYGTIARDHNGGSLSRARESDTTLADVLEYIRPTGDSGETYMGDHLSNHPLHYDPNFSALTYGEVKSRNKNQIRYLNPEADDILAFYTGLTHQGSTKPHRYIIGYFTVNKIIDFSDYLGEQPPQNDDGRVIVDDLPASIREQLEEKLAAHSANAHVKRYKANGTIDAGLIIVDGKEPGGLMKKAHRISQSVPGGHGFTHQFEKEFNVQTTKKGRDTGWLGGFKKAHRLGISGSDFVKMVSN